MNLAWPFKPVELWDESDAKRKGIEVAEEERKANFDLKEGLIMISRFQDGQNGLLVERVRINMPYTPCGSSGTQREDEKEKKRKFIVELNLQCLNESKSPSFDKM